ncbi:helix-turn-helix domain-containing protein [Roseovarius sp.]|uniref:MerR family transcriptional regulator n=1 Tax=Roseovarius sp. TaxID=1486281 RepID=UPI0026191D1B|nr:helix-turn-helix domain-containing protein [Roseovarius sp.]MDM8164801.1 helix-turn-helix domain-containing protein [Roseovarius sp.]
MFSIGELSRRTGVKVPTIRYYEEMGLIAAAGRTSGNQRRYGRDELEQLGFIRHARDLGFPLGAISSLIELQRHPDRTCQEASDIARAQLDDVRHKIARLRALETELGRIVDGCSGRGAPQDCYVLASLSDHDMCKTEHGADH